jgi:aryl-alcohol dehydrogenase-like predicted oxidoreductase
VYSSEQSGWAPTAWSTHNKEPTWKLLDELQAISRELNQSVARVSLRWLLQKPAVVAPIVGVRTLEQLEDNLGAASFVLSAEQMHRLDAVSQPHHGYPYDTSLIYHRDPPGMPLPFEVVPVVRTSKPMFTYATN